MAHHWSDAESFVIVNGTQSRLRRLADRDGQHADNGQDFAAVCVLDGLWLLAPHVRSHGSDNRCVVGELKGEMQRAVLMAHMECGVRPEEAIDACLVGVVLDPQFNQAPHALGVEHRPRELAPYIAHPVTFLPAARVSRLGGWERPWYQSVRERTFAVAPSYAGKVQGPSSATRASLTVRSGSPSGLYSEG
jgi:hypothetical protein